ncbi:MAG: hypothetical protein WDZ81_00525 [Candidatus Saccharimonadales bacterium]
MIYIFYRPNSEHEREVNEFAERLKRERIEPKMFSMDTREGAEKAKTYDLWEYPAVVATGQHETPLQTWTGKLPMLGDVTYFARQ